MKTCNLAFEPDLLPDVLTILGKHIVSFSGESPYDDSLGDATRLATIILSPREPSADDKSWIEATYRAYMSNGLVDTVGWPVLQLLETQHIKLESYGGVVADLSVEDYGQGNVIDLAIDFGRDSINLAADLLSAFWGLPGMCYDQGILSEMARYHLSAARHFASLTLEDDAPEAVDDCLKMLNYS